MVITYQKLKKSPLLQIWEKLENPLLQENLLSKKLVSQVLSTITRDSTIKRYTITRGDCTKLSISVGVIGTEVLATRQASGQKPFLF